MKYFVFSDVHNGFDELMQALTNAGFEYNNKEHILICCGDLFDRLDKAVQLFNFIYDFKIKYPNRFIYIKGNHELLLKQCVYEMKHEGCDPIHRSNGTIGTISQFIEADILDKVLKFIDNNSIYYYELDDYIFCHAGLPLKLIYEHEKPKLVINKQASDQDFQMHTWDNPFDNWEHGIYPSDKTMVVGHWGTVEANYLYHNKGSGKYDENGCFDTFIDKSIVALDTTTALSHKVNIYVIEK